MKTNPDNVDMVDNTVVSDDDEFMNNMMLWRSPHFVEEKLMSKLDHHPRPRN